MKKFRLIILLCFIMITGCTKDFVIVDKTKEMSDFVCAEALDNFYSDDNYSYYWNCMMDNMVVVRYKDGKEVLVSEALKNKTIEITDLDRFNIEYIKYFNEYQKYSKLVDNVKLELDIPNDWNYEEVERNIDNDFYKFALKIYKSDDEYAVLYFYNSSFGVCGTGRTSKKIVLNNGNDATVGYYHDNKAWSDISFYDMNRNVAVINNGLTGVLADELLEFIKTINIVSINE